MVSWLADQGMILAYDYQSEIVPFITRVPESNDTQAVTDLVSDILAHANDDHFTPRRALRTLNQMRQRELATDEIDNAVAALIDEHQDLGILMHVGDSPPAEPPPLSTADELKLLLENDVPGAVALLQEYSAEEALNAYAWHDIGNTLASVVRESPELGFTLLDTIDHSSAVGMAVVGPVIRGWSKAAVDDELAQRILSRIAALDISRVAGDVAAMLVGVPEAGSQGTKWRRFATSRDLAKVCWDAIGTEPTDEKDNWFHAALNSTAGQLAIYWLQVTEDERASAASEWKGISRHRTAAG
jgi:hypothetical protein